MAWKLVNPNITNDPSYLEPRISNDETNISNNTSQLAQKMSKADIAININDYPKQGSETDDTARLQRAVNACIAGSTLLIPFTTTLTVSSNILVPVAIKVTGGGTINFTSADTGVATTGNEVETALFDFNTQITDTSQVMYGIVFDGITFIGTVTDNTRADCQTMIRTWFCNDITIKNCTFKNTNIAIRPRNSYNILIDGNRFEHLWETKNDNINGYGIMAGTTGNLTVSNNFFYCVERHSVYLDVYANTNIVGNQFIGDGTYSARTGYELPIKLTEGYGCTITGNTVRYLCGAVWIDTSFNGSSQKGPENVAISGNVFQNMQTNTHINTGWIYLHGMYSKNIKVSNNILKTAYNDAIVWDGSGDIEIVNNVIDGGQYGVKVASTDTNGRIKISENDFKNLTSGVNVGSANPQVYGRNNRYLTCTSVSNFSGTYPNVCLLDNHDMTISDIKLINGGQTTIDVSLGTRFQISNTAVTNVVGLSGQGKNQIVYLIATNGNTILKNSSTFRLKTGADETLALGQVKGFYQQTYGNWWEI